MYLQPFIITVAMSCIVSSPIKTTTTTKTTTSSSTTTAVETIISSSTTTEIFMVSSPTTDTIISSSTITPSTLTETIGTLSITTKLSSPSPTTTITKTTAISVTTTTTLTMSKRNSPHNRSCLHNGTHTGWLCDDQTTCVWLKAVCGGAPTCPDGSDEAAGCSKDPRYCPYTIRNYPGWRCDNGNCIHRFSICDSFSDCSDGSDERAGCEELDLIHSPGENNTLTERWAANKNCRECLDIDNWRCDNGHCVSKYNVCDGKPHCLDGSDEREGCKSDYKDRFPPNNNSRSCLTKFGLTGWLCDDQTTCVWLAHVCGGAPTCPDGSDEAAGCFEDPRYCWFETGHLGWRCGSGECIYKGNVCDGQPECRDRSDEIAGCAAMDLVPCPTDNNTLTERWAANVDCRQCWDQFNNWRCDNGRCTKKLQVCDGDPHGSACDDGSDEWAGCELVTCGNDSSITTAAMFAGGDCRRCWHEDYWRCNDGGCIGKEFLCNGVENCPSGEDETVACSSLVPCLDNGVTVMTEPNYNQPGQCRSCFRTDVWRCNSGQCIVKHRVCNNVMFGRWDCKDGSDEDPGSGCPANVTCVADKSIVTTSQFSNGTVEECLSCPGNSLGSKGKIANNYKRCKTGLCKHKVHFCNGFEDCEDGSDEIGCNIFAYFDTKIAVMLSFGLVVLTAYLYKKYTNFYSINLISTPKKYPKKSPILYKNIQKYCDILESENNTNADQLKRLHTAIRNKRNGLKNLIVVLVNLYEEPQLCHKYYNKVLSLENEFHINVSESLMYIRLVAGSNEFTEKFANAIEQPGFFSKLSFSSTKRLEYVSLKTRHYIHLIKALSKMVLFYLDVIKDIALFFKLWNIVSQLEDMNILYHLLVYISCLFIFLAQMIVGLYLVIQLGKPHKKLPPSLFALVIFLLFLISPLIPIVLVVKESLLNSDLEEKRQEMKKHKRKEITKFLTFVSLKNERATETKRLFSFYKITNSVLESLPQIVIYCIFCLTYYYNNSLLHILFTDTNTTNTILFACSIPISLFSVVSGINTYSSMEGKGHYTKTFSYFFQIISRVCAILSFISPLYVAYFIYIKPSFEFKIVQGLIYDKNYSWIPDFLTTSLISITYPHVISFFPILLIIFAPHGLFIYFYSHKNIPGFSDAPLFHKLTHTIANIFIVLPWRPLGQEDQRRRSREHQNFHFAMAVTNIFIIIFSSIFREYTQVDYIKPGYGTKHHLEWIHNKVNILSLSTLPLLEQLSPYHYPIGILLNIVAHIPWLLLVLILQGLGIFTMSIYYKKFHPWRAIINTRDIHKTITVHEFFATTNEVLDEESEIEWVDENLMEEDNDTDENENKDVINQVELEEKHDTETCKEYIHHKDGEQYELRVIDESYSLRKKLAQDRSILTKTLDIHREKKENSRRQFFSEMTRTKSNERKALKNSFLIKTNKVQTKAEVYQTDTKKEPEVYDIEETVDLQEVIHMHREDRQEQDSDLSPELASKILDDISTIIEDEDPSEKEQHLHKDICREIILDLVDDATDISIIIDNEDPSEKEQHLHKNICREIILDLVDDAVDKVYQQKTVLIKIQTDDK